VDDRQRGDRARCCGRGRRRRLERLELAARRAVDDVPAALAQLLADRVRRLKVTGATKLDAPVEKLLSFCLIRSSWL
jgi:hypothetical protein